jgi:hypothetical protein
MESVNRSLGKESALMGSNLSALETNCTEGVLHEAKAKESPPSRARLLNTLKMKALVAFEAVIWALRFSTMQC